MTGRDIKMSTDFQAKYGLELHTSFNTAIRLSKLYEIVDRKIDLEDIPTRQPPFPHANSSQNTKPHHREI